MNISATHSQYSTISYQPVRRQPYNAAETGKATQTVAASLSGLQQNHSAAPVGVTSSYQNISYSSLSQSMSPAFRGFMPAANSLTNLADLYGFKNQYLYTAVGKTYAKIDTDSDGLWSYSELKAYADDYEQATGKALDVDDLMARYSDTGDNTGYIRYTGQQQMYSDDALGISYANDQLLLADNNLTTGKQAKINQKYLDDFVSKYTYGSPNKLYAKIDQNDDGVWTIDEMRKYADAYEKATGIRLDADALFAKYDLDGSGTLKYDEQNAMYKDDALGLSRISDALTAKPEESKGPDKDTGLSDRIRDSLKGLPASTKQRLWSTFSDSLQKSAMLDAFMMTNSLMNKRYYGGYGYPFGATNTMWTMGNLGLMYSFI